MMRLRYDDLLKTAEWRVFSWECKQRVGFKCAFCTVTGEAKLQTHHWWYEAGKYPWDVAWGQVCVMCAECHAVMHREFETFKRYVLTTQGETPGAREGIRWFRRYVFAGFTPEGFTRYNARLLLGEEHVGAVGAAAVRVLAGVLVTSNGREEMDERVMNAG